MEETSPQTSGSIVSPWTYMYVGIYTRGHLCAYTTVVHACTYKWPVSLAEKAQVCGEHYILSLSLSLSL